MSYFYSSDGNLTIYMNEHGTKFWRNSRSQRHREGAPAIVWTDGSNSWWVAGQRHRVDGPAVTYSDGYKEYWIEGEQYSDELTYWMAAIEWKKNNEQ